MLKKKKEGSYVKIDFFFFLNYKNLCNVVTYKICSIYITLLPSHLKM